MKAKRKKHHPLDELVQMVDEKIIEQSLPSFIGMLKGERIDYQQLPADSSFRVKYRLLYALIDEHTQHVARSLSYFEITRFLNLIRLSDQRDKTTQQKRVIRTAEGFFWGEATTREYEGTIDKARQYDTPANWVQLTATLVENEYFFGFSWHITPYEYWAWVSKNLSTIIQEETKRYWQRTHPAA
jgi:hypothetical protein